MLMRTLKNTTSLAMIVALAMPAAGLAQGQQAASQGAAAADLPDCALDFAALAASDAEAVRAEARKLEEAGQLATIFPCAAGDGTRLETFQAAKDYADLKAAEQGAPSDTATATAGANDGAAKQQGAAPGKRAREAAKAQPDSPAQKSNQPQTKAQARAQAAAPQPNPATGASVPGQAPVATAPQDTTAPRDTAAAQGATAASPGSDGLPDESRITTVGQGPAGNAAVIEDTPPDVAATSDQTGAGIVDQTTETVTEDEVRASDEEFATSVTGQVNAKAAPKAGKKDKGMSNFEKALVAGLGTLAVGAILKNGDKVVSNSGDRVVVNRDGQLRVLRDDDVLLRQPGNEVQTQTYSDGSTRTVVTRDNGVQIETIRAADGQVLRRAHLLPNGERVILFDDTRAAAPVDVSALPAPAPATRQVDPTDEDALRRALAEVQARQPQRSFTLSQIRHIPQVRALAPEIDLENVTFATGSAAISPQEAEELTALGNVMRRMIADNPSEVFLIEGHTDAVGAATYNLALSDRRAESVALALSEYFDVPPENMVLQGYGESQLKVPTLEAERANRRATVRRITGLLAQRVTSNN